MTKVDLINYIAEQTGLTKVDSTKAIEAFMEGVVTGLKKEGKVALTGFYTFTAEKRPAREARNPKTSEIVKVPAKVVVKGKAGSKLNEALN